MKTYSKIISVVWVVCAILCFSYGAYVNATIDFNNALVLYVFGGICIFQFIIRKKVIDKRLKR